MKLNLLLKTKYKPSTYKLTDASQKAAVFTNNKSNEKIRILWRHRSCLVWASGKKKNTEIDFVIYKEFGCKDEEQTHICDGCSLPQFIKVMLQENGKIFLPIEYLNYEK